MKFNSVYYKQIEYLEEGKFKSLAAAGLLATSGLAGNISAASPAPITSQIKQNADSDIINSIIKFTRNAESSGIPRLTAYKCPTGHLTIGYGTNIEEPHNASKLRDLGYNIQQVKAKKQKISESHSDILLRYGLQQALSDARVFLSDFDSQPLVVRAILVDMAYNLGLPKLMKFKDFRVALLNKNYNAASEEMVDSLWYKQVGNRSKRLVNMMRTVAKERHQND